MLFALVALSLSAALLLIAVVKSKISSRLAVEKRVFETSATTPKLLEAAPTAAPSKEFVEPSDFVLKQNRSNYYTELFKKESEERFMSWLAGKSQQSSARFPE